MISFFYLMLIVGWALLILLINCRKAREKRRALEIQEAQTRNAVHIIQIGSSFYDVIPVSHQPSSNSRCYRHSRCRNSASNLSTTSHSNPTFVLDEGIYPNAPPVNSDLPPPSYEEVIRLPNLYPKLFPPPENEVPPPQISVIEVNEQSISISPPSSSDVTTATNQQKNS